MLQKFTRTLDHLEDFFCNILTVDKDSKAKEVQVSFSTTRIPANVRVAFRQQHGTAPQATSSQVCHNLQSIVGETFQNGYIVNVF